MFSSKMVTAISPDNNSHIPFVSCFTELRAVAKLLKGVYPLFFLTGSLISV
jgi:hypothetical protein